MIRIRERWNDEYSSQQLDFDNARSISVADPLSTTLVGSCTTCVRSKLEIILFL